jgi:hypothetical protein
MLIEFRHGPEGRNRRGPGRIDAFVTSHSRAYKALRRPREAGCGLSLAGIETLAMVPS